jgi:hypothetical protein
MSTPGDRRGFLNLIVGLSLAFGGSAAPAAAQTPDLFETRVRPVLAERCTDCHGAAAAGGLRVDSREALLTGGKSGPAIVPGDPEQSLLIRAVRHASGVRPMPFGSAALSSGEIDALAEWIAAGAEWPVAAAGAAPAPLATAREYVISDEQRAFWSFQPLARPAVPAVSDASWSKTDIDRFVLARLEREGLRPVRSAERRDLIRRATLDLTGLLPTPEEVGAFEADQAPDAFEKVVDRLLASPRYGETWGRHWLDVARYGEDDYRSLDPKGRGHNPYPNAYLYRDWVIKAFNDDLPYDEFVRAQLAADRLDEPRRVRHLPALGFLGLGPWFYDNGAVEITRADERHDRVDVVSRGFLGLTVGCARCHDHKYDPISTKDYYALAGVFLNSPYHEYPRVPKAVAEARDAAEKKIERKEKLLAAFLTAERTQLAETLALQASRYMQAAWRVTGEPKDEQWKVANEEKLDYELFDRWMAFLARPPKFYPYLTAWQEMIARGGTKVEAGKLADEFQATLLDVMFAYKEVEEENEIIRAKALPGTKKKEKANKPNEFITNDDFCPGCGLELKSLPLEQTNLWTDVFQRDLTTDFNPAMFNEPPKPGLLVFRGWGLERQLGADRRAYIDELRAGIERERKALPPPYPFVHGVKDAETPENLKVSLRGSPYRLGDEVPRRFLAVLHEDEPPPFAEGSGRLELAEAIVNQPIAARVIVNRVWKWHFGTGLVDSPSNFGRTGDRPSHPDLLDHLASWFVDHGYSLKALHREIMRSAVYQLGTERSEAAEAKDAANRWHWRFNVRRMTAEQIRDTTLFAAGTLDEAMGGPSVALTPFVTRRTVYGAVSRYKLDGFLALFDVPSPNLSAEQRFTTNVPLQRLFFMNADFMRVQSERLAMKVADAPEWPARIDRLYQILFGRLPTDAERGAGLSYLRTEPMTRYEERKAEEKKAPADGTNGKDGKDQKSRKDGRSPKDAADAKASLDGAEPSPNGMMAGVTPGAADGKAAEELPPVTPWGQYVRVLLSSNEFLFTR